MKVQQDKLFFSELTDYIKKMNEKDFYDNKKINLPKVEKIMIEKALSPIVIGLLSELPKEKTNAFLSTITKREIHLKNKISNYFKTVNLSEEEILSSKNRIGKYLDILKNFFDDSIEKKGDQFLVNSKNIKFLYESHLIFYYNYNYFKYNLHLASGNVKESIKCARNLDAIEDSLGLDNSKMNEQAAQILSRFEILLEKIKETNN